MKLDKNIVLDSIKQLFLQTMGMSHSVIKHSPSYESECYSLNGEFYRIDTFRDSQNSNERVFCIEWAENEQEARYNHFEDAWLYHDTMDLQEMLATIQNDILNG